MTQRQSRHSVNVHNVPILQEPDIACPREKNAARRWKSFGALFWPALISDGGFIECLHPSSILSQNSARGRPIHQGEGAKCCCHLIAAATLSPEVRSSSGPLRHPSLGYARRSQASCATHPLLFFLSPTETLVPWALNIHKAMLDYH